MPMGAIVKTTGRATHTVKGATVIRYHELLRQKLDELRLDVYTFFRLAHIYSFGTDPDISTDVAQFSLHAIIPRYVEKYLDTL